MINEKDMNVTIEDNGAAYLIVVSTTTCGRMVVAYTTTLGDAWRHIEWLYRVETQHFTVGAKKIPVTEWLQGMKMAGYLD